MISRKAVFWEVDTQADFMLPGGKLYVPGAEKLLPNIRRLTDEARQGRVFLVSHGCYHSPDDPEFGTFPPHCVKGTPGAEYIPEAMTRKVLRIANEPDANIPLDIFSYRQVLLEKQTLDIFETRLAGELVQRFPTNTEFVVFGVVTEYCVAFAAKGLLERGRNVSVVRDAIKTLKAEDGERTIAELKALGANFISTDQAIELATAAEQRARD